MNKTNEFYICEEDNIFDELSALYEDLPCAMYPDAPDLDLSITWDTPFADTDNLVENIYEEDYIGYGCNLVDFDRGDIILASVYQAGEIINTSHRVRPFLIIYANANMAYGFQLGTSFPNTLLDYMVEVPDYQACGLNSRGAVFVNMVRGIQQVRIKKYIGHITPALKQALLDKLYEIQDNENGRYDDCLLNDGSDRLMNTIRNVERLRC